MHKKRKERNVQEVKEKRDSDKKRKQKNREERNDQEIKEKRESVQ